MKTRFCLFVLLLISIGGTILVHSQGEKKPRTVADYRMRTLSEMTTLQPDYIAKSPDYKPEILRMVVHGDPLPSRVKVLYDGTTRPVLETRRQIITHWASSSRELRSFIPFLMTLKCFSLKTGSTIGW